MAILDAFSQLFAALAGEQLKILLETKHLYQKVSIEPKDIVTQVMEKVLPDKRQVYFAELVKGMQQRLTLTENPTFAGVNTLQLWLPVKNVKLFCEKCDAREAFKPIWHSDITFEIRTKHKTQASLGTQNFKIEFVDSFQLFALTYQCQRCESLPTTFIVKRSGNDIFVEGRSPLSTSNSRSSFQTKNGSGFVMRSLPFKQARFLRLCSICGGSSNSSLVEKQGRWATRRQAT